MHCAVIGQAGGQKGGGGSECCVPNNARYGRLTCERERASERTRGRKENRTLKKGRGEERESWKVHAAAGRIASAIPACHLPCGDDNLTSHPPAHMYSLPPFPYYVLNPLYGKWSAPSDFQWMTGGTSSLPPTQIGCDLQPKHAARRPSPLFVSSFRFLSLSVGGLQQEFRLMAIYELLSPLFRVICGLEWQRPPTPPTTNEPASE